MTALEPTLIVSYVYKDVSDYHFARLWRDLKWVQRDNAPRREYWSNNFDLPYTYGSGEYARTYPAQDYDPFVWDLMDLHLNEDLQAQFNCCFINGYEHQRQHLGWHADDSPEMNNEHPIAVVSLGAERELWFRPKNDYKDITKVKLTHGSLFIMPAGMQLTHDHRIPKADREVGPRISLTYRNIIQHEVCEDN